MLWTTINIISCAKMSNCDFYFLPDFRLIIPHSDYCACGCIINQTILTVTNAFIANRSSLWPIDDVQPVMNNGITCSENRNVRYLVV